MDIINIKVKDVKQALKDDMFRLMSTYYDNLSKMQFDKDLSNKDHVIIMVEGGLVRGFTTIEHLHLKIEDKEILGVFSGNTIMDLSIPPSLHLQQAFVRYIEDLKKTSDKALYWFLICKGYKTYRYLNVYCKKYYPSYMAKTPEMEQKIMDAYAKFKYPDNYDLHTGIIKHDDSMDYLKDDVAPITERLLRKPEVAYFAKKNPGHIHGDELVCLASFSDDNLKPGYYRALR
ncbi:hypothetical protein EZV73_09510 [Acidaminobacter sp. JC074]|uniref:hypothetical protein n=1 Tax=Acidaminobacter sp. JC074 TaxID=2530199 RepID=UPI001F0EBEFB|nr:hypothetical protein [Acidaminobacter sp. JC074]MCH4887810.1 hypothetical protein [Acidaminobacter sp. JC074]